MSTLEGAEAPSIVQYQYDNSGMLATVTDSESGIKSTYYYDLIDRLCKYKEAGTDYSMILEYGFNEMNQVSYVFETINGNTRSIGITYDADNRVSSYRKGSVTEAYTYDAYSRVTNKATTVKTSTSDAETRLTETLRYRTNSSGNETGQVNTLSINSNGDYSTYFTYGYDMNGNIVSVTSSSKTTKYTYDSANQLIREDNQAEGKTWTWTYDAAGNILSRNEYAYTTGTLGTATDTVNYVYDTGDWGDLLKSFDGQAITYDGIGNPTSIGGRTFTWKHGRELATLTEGGVTWTNTYNADGLRIKRTNGTLTYKYYYAGGQLVRIGVGSKYLDISYDASGVPMALYYSGYQVDNAHYYYVTNVQGDVVAILNDAGTAVVTYTYDAWGNILTVGGSMADTLGVYNPLRYRGYVYDEETGFYYVSSRYYNPEIGRFINADDIDYLGADGSPLSYNLFAYCMNNSVNRFDVNGNWSLPNWAKVAIGAVATVAAVAVTVATGGAAAPVLIGVAASTIGGAAVSAVNHRVTTGSWEGAGKAALDGAADGFMTGGLCALGGSVVGGAVRTIKNAKSGITIGKSGQFEKVAELAKTRHYSGLKEFDFIKKVAGQKAAETVGWWQNKCVVKGVMALKGAIYDCGGALTGAYAKEVALTKGYQYLYNVWLM